MVAADTAYALVLLATTVSVVVLGGDPVRWCWRRYRHARGRRWVHEQQRAWGLLHHPALPLGDPFAGMTITGRHG